MNRRLLNILLSAFVVAALASFVVYKLVTKQIGSGGGRQITTVVVAAHDLEVGTMLKAGDVTTGEVVGPVAKGALTKVDDAVNRGVLVAFYQGETLVDQRLAVPGSGAGLAATIPPGMRACAVRVDDVVGVAGFASPGSRVDVLISGKAPGSDNTTGTRVRTLLQNVEVLSAGKNYKPDKEGNAAEATVVNLLVSPEQAEQLSLASSNETRIQLVLRNPVDRDIAHPPGSAMASLLTGSAPAPKPLVTVASVPRKIPAPIRPDPAAVAPPPPPPPAVVVHRIQVMNGPKSTEQAFEGVKR